MATDTDFNALLDKPAEDFKAPTLIPEGSYLWHVGPYKFSKVGKNQTDVAEYELTAVQPGPEVDESALAEALDGRGLNEVKTRHTAWLTSDALHHTVGEEGSFAVNCGVDVHGKTTRQVLEECVGQQVWGQFKHEISQKSGKPFGQIVSFAPAS